MRLPGVGAVTGWAALRLLGGSFFDGLARDGVTELPVWLCTGPTAQIRQAPGSIVSRERLLPGEAVMRYGIPCTVGRRAAFDAMRKAPHLRAAVVVIDMVAAAEIASVSQVREYVLLHPGWEGVDQAREALDLADEGSRSPRETDMRLVWEIDAGFPRPLVNRPVWDLHGNLLGYPDILDVEAGVVGEFDGAEHRRARRHSRDVAREEGFRRRNLEYFKITGPDSREVVLDRMRSTRSRALWCAPADRLWTLEPPPGWEPEMSLDELFAYREMIHRPPMTISGSSTPHDGSRGSHDVTRCMFSGARTCVVSRRTALPTPARIREPCIGGGE